MLSFVTKQRTLWRQAWEVVSARPVSWGTTPLSKSDISRVLVFGCWVLPEAAAGAGPVKEGKIFMIPCRLSTSLSNNIPISVDCWLLAPSWMTSAACETNGLVFLPATRAEIRGYSTKIPRDKFCLSPTTDAEMPNWPLVHTVQCLLGKPRITRATMGSHSLLRCGQEDRWGRGSSQRVWFAGFIINVRVFGIFLKASVPGVMWLYRNLTYL